MATWYIDTDADEGSPDGTEAHPYNTLNEAEQAKDANITGAGPVTFICQGSTQADDAAVSVGGWTTTAADYVEITTAAADRHAGVWSDMKYRLNVNGSRVIYLNEDYIRLDGLQITKTSTANGQDGILNYGQTNGANDLRVSNCIIKLSGGTTYSEAGIYGSGTYGVLRIWNCIIYGGATHAAAANAGVIVVDGTTTEVFGCTIIGGYYGIRAGNNRTITAKNCYAVGVSSDAYSVGTSATITQTNCAADDTTADGTDPHDSVAYSTATFQSVTPGDATYLKLTLDGGLTGHGATLTDDPPGSTALALDIAGATRTTTWDIGAFEYISGVNYLPLLIYNDTRQPTDY